MIANFKKKRNSTRSWLLTIGGVLVLAIVGVLLFADIHVYRKRAQLNTQIEDLQKKVQALKEKNSNLKEGIDKSDDADYIEKVAREELDLQRNGETVVSFIPPKTNDQKEVIESKNSWQLWLGWIGGSWEWIRGN